VDDQLRGRAGRQGDPGGSVTFVSLEDDMVVRNAADVLPPSPTIKRNGRVEDEQVDWAVAHAQRVAEGVNHEIHRNTWRYSVVIEQQRKALAERRERLLKTDVAAEMLRDRFPEETEDIDEDRLSEAARSIALFHIDRLWAEHLALLSEGAVVRVDPLTSSTAGPWRSMRWYWRSRSARWPRSADRLSEEWESRVKLIRPSDLDLPVHDNCSAPTWTAWSPGWQGPP
jgi:preprotein translocase subunit SecA